MKNFFKKHQKELLITAAAILSILLIVCVVALVGDYSKGLHTQAEDAARLYAQQNGLSFHEAVERFVDRAEVIAATVPEDPAEWPVYFVKQDGIPFFRYMNDGVEYYSNGVALESHKEALDVRTAVASGKVAVTGRFVDYQGEDEKTDHDGSTPCFAVYVPIADREGMDGLIVFYNIEELEKVLIYEPGDGVLPVYFGVCSTKGDVLKNFHSTEFDIEEEDLFFEKLRTLTNSKETVDTLFNGVDHDTIATISVHGENYIVTFDNAPHSDGQLYTVSMFRSADVYTDGYSLAGTISAIVAILTVILILLLVFILITRFREIRRYEDFELTDPIYGCQTYKGFARRAEVILARSRIAKYAVVYASIPHIAHIRDLFGEDDATDTVKFIVSVYEKSMLTDETFGMIDEEQFVLLLHYNQIEDIYNRLKVLNVVLYNCPVTLSKKYTLKQSSGICCVDRELNVPLRKLLDSAITAERVHRPYTSGSARVYEERLHDMFLRELEVEAKMEGALRNGDFKLFYQPKYNIENNRIDSAEILVRWYDPELNRFYQPSEFIPLFEANGFIRDLDKYMFEEVCKSIRDTFERAQTPVPLSVNVSRVTAISSDFVDFYVSIKKKYYVPDGLLTLEFTESFVYDNLESLRIIIQKLKNNGFRCSVDNFGAGHSSLNVLKLLSMDELKLDRFFIQSGISKERDDCLLGTVISLAKSLDMQVIQQGVEDFTEVHRLEALGCDVIQGYIYSKPLSANEYSAFLESGGQILASGYGTAFDGTTADNFSDESDPDESDTDESDPDESDAAADFEEDTFIPEQPEPEEPAFEAAEDSDDGL